MTMAEKCETEWRPEFDRDYDSLKEGMFVCGTEGNKIGEVEKIYVNPDKKTGHFLVKKGAEIDRDLYIPIKAIKAVDRDNVFLECPSGECAKEEWAKAPAGEVEKPGIFLKLSEESPDVYPNLVKGEVSEYAHRNEPINFPDT